MTAEFHSSLPLKDFGLWAKIKDRRPPYSFDIDLTARCNNDCRHCYINLPASDSEARSRELSADEIDRISGEAADLGAFWCLLSGGEPLLREDFSEIYMRLKRKGLLLSVFTNATLIRKEHIDLFRNYPPRDIEVTVYGSTRETYERISRVPGSYDAFRRGLDLLERTGLNLRLKAVAMKSNLGEFADIAAFCRDRSNKAFRFDPFLHLRYDRDPGRNEEIRAERLSPEEIVGLEKSDGARIAELEEKCASSQGSGGNVLGQAKGAVPVFICNAGVESFSVSADGFFRLCPSLNRPDCVYDLQKGTLRDAWNEFVPRIRALESGRPEFLDTCPSCEVLPVCHWCPAVSDLETGRLDAPVDFYCRTARARGEMLPHGGGHPGPRTDPKRNP